MLPHSCFCSALLPAAWLVIDSTTVLSSDINGKKMSTAFSCLALPLLVWDFIPGRTQIVVAARVLQDVCLLLQADGKEKHTRGLDLVGHHEPVSRGETSGD